MPEIAEVKIMGDFVNYIASEEKFFDQIEKSEVSKVKTDLSGNEGVVYEIAAKSRGKELMLTICPVDGSPPRNLIVTLGMSGNFVYARKDGASFDRVMKHAHLRFRTVRGNYLVLHDIRRFAKWKWVDGWTRGRGPCPLTEFNEFSEFLRSNWYKHKVFNTPLNELLMNQGVFNGVGNYLRAEILYRLDTNPFQPANQLSHEEMNRLIIFTHHCARDAYIMGGGELKDWVNPKGSDRETFDTWMKCYGKGLSVVDKTGRRFWYDPRWENYCPY